MELVIATQDAATSADLRVALADTSHNVTAVANSADLLRACLGGDVDLALVDLELGSMDGVEVIRLLKDMDAYVKVVPVVGPTHTGMEFALRAIGIFYFMLKPVDRNELLAVLESAERKGDARQ